jgi:hypothetical protein
MTSFGVAFATFTLFASAVAASIAAGSGRADDVVRTFVLLGIVASAIGVVVACAIDALSPRMIFTGRVAAPALLGGACAGLVFAFSSTAIALFGSMLPDAFTASFIPCVVTAAVVLPCRRARAWHCLRCGYDRHGSERSPHCPECGATSIA